MDDSLHEMTHSTMIFRVGFNSVPEFRNRLRPVLAHPIVPTLANQKRKARLKKVCQKAKAKCSGSQKSKKVPIGNSCA